MKHILGNKIPAKLKSDAELELLMNELFTEVEDDYSFSIRKAIGKYMFIKTRVIFSKIFR